MLYVFSDLAVSQCCMYSVTLQRVNTDKTAAIEQLERQRDSLQQRLTQMETDLQTVLHQQQTSHEDHLARSTTEMVNNIYQMLLAEHLALPTKSNNFPPSHKTDHINLSLKGLQG